MKRFNCLLMPLMVVFVFVLCSCQSDKDVSGPVRVKDVALKASLSGAESRTTMTDTYGGAFAETWNKDVLSIYHSYRSNGTALSLMPLDFATTVTGASTGTFSYSGGLSDYTYNPSQPLYAFNKLTGTGQSTPTTSGGTAATPISLSLTGWASQDGTLKGSQNAALYDAMAGYATTNAVGVPDALTMKHLGGILNFHLSCSDFTDGNGIGSIMFTAKGSDGTTPLGFFPSSATVSIASDGTCTFTTTPSGLSLWSPSGSFVPVGKAIDVYLSSFPISSIASGSTLLIYVYSSMNEYGVGMPLDNFSLSPGKVKSIPLTLTKISVSTATPASYSRLYAWDATDWEPVVVNGGKAPTNANYSVTATDRLNYADHLCKDCPNANEISWYLKGGCYWDDGSNSKNGGNGTDYTMAGSVNGVNTTKSGMWFLKKCFINNFSSTKYSGVGNCTPAQLSSMTAAQISALNLSKYYFFLPATGYTGRNNATFYGGLTSGSYWSSTPYYLVTEAYKLGFNSTSAFVTNISRTLGSSPWQGQ